MNAPLPDCESVAIPPPPPPPGNAATIGALSIIITSAALLTIGIAGEIYLRLFSPFIHSSRPMRFVPAVGMVVEPGVQVRHTDGQHYWTTARSNSLGFVDREPDPERFASAGCRVVAIGDSLTEALEVPIADKFHVLLEERSARDLPDLDVATMAFGLSATAQVHQLALFDEYARQFAPHLLVLVFSHTDLHGNSPHLMAMRRRWHPTRAPYVSAVRDDHGEFRLFPPARDWRQFLLPSRLEARWQQWVHVAIGASARRSAIAQFVHERARGRWDWYRSWQRRGRRGRAISGVRRDALNYTAFALSEFRKRADSAGAALAILAASDLGGPGHRDFELLNAIAGPLGISVVSHHDYITRHGGDFQDVDASPRDPHWSRQGHQWAAGAVLEWLRDNRQVCAGGYRG